MAVFSGEAGDLFGHVVAFGSCRYELGLQRVDSLLVVGRASSQRRARFASLTLGHLAGRLRSPGFALRDGTALFGGTPALGVLLAELLLVFERALEASGFLVVRSDLTSEFCEFARGLVLSGALRLSVGASYEVVVVSVEAIQLTSGVLEALGRGLRAGNRLIREPVLVNRDSAGLFCRGDMGPYQALEVGGAALSSSRLEGIEPRGVLCEHEWFRALGWSRLEEHVLGRVGIGVVAQIEGWMGVLVRAKHRHTSP